MIKQKKGAETIVVWILLIGFTLIMTATVFMFEKNKAKIISEGTVNFQESKLECESVAINNAQCFEEEVKCRVPVVNTGRISIAGLIFRDKMGEKAEFGSHIPGSTYFPMKPGTLLSPWIKDRNPDLDFSAPNPIEIIPLVNISNKLYACNTKIINASIICDCYP